MPPSGPANQYPKLPVAMSTVVLSPMLRALQWQYQLPVLFEITYMCRTTNPLDVPGNWLPHIRPLLSPGQEAHEGCDLRLPHKGVGCVIDLQDLGVGHRRVGAARGRHWCRQRLGLPNLAGFAGGSRLRSLAAFTGQKGLARMMLQQDKSGHCLGQSAHQAAEEVVDDDIGEGSDLEGVA